MQLGWVAPVVDFETRHGPWLGRHCVQRGGGWIVASGGRFPCGKVGRIESLHIASEWHHRAPGGPVLVGGED